MTKYSVHTLASAPDASKPVLTALQQSFGFVPNLAGAIANSPKLLTAFAAVFQQVHSSSLSEQEIQIILLSDAVANACTYAVALHTALALKEGVSSAETDAIRGRQAPQDSRFAALATVATMLIKRRGHLTEQELHAFVAAGFTKEQLLEVVAIVAASTITNYVGSIANPPLEEQFQPFAWEDNGLSEPAFT